MSWTLTEAMEYYKRNGAPGDQNALLQLLREIQQEQGSGIPSYMVGEIARNYDIKESLILALIRRIPSLRLEDKHCLELCAGPNCGKHTHLLSCAESLLKQGHPFELKTVGCMRQCGKGPNLRWDGKLYNRATEELIRGLASGKE